LSPRSVDAPGYDTMRALGVPAILNFVNKGLVVK
jgi:hypothetical protein